MNLHPHWHRTRRTDWGFTLVEVLVVILMAGVLASIAAPAWFRYLNTQRLNSGIEEIYLAMREAQSQALRTKRTWQASFRTENEVVQWSVHQADEEAFWEPLHENVAIDDSLTTLPTEGGALYVRFNHRGWVVGDGDEIPELPQHITLMSTTEGEARRCTSVATLLGSLRRAKDEACGS